MNLCWSVSSNFCVFTYVFRITKTYIDIEILKSLHVTFQLICSLKLSHHDRQATLQFVCVCVCVWVCVCVCVCLCAFMFVCKSGWYEWVWVTHMGVRIVDELCYWFPYPHTHTHLRPMTHAVRERHSYWRAPGSLGLGGDDGTWLTRRRWWLHCKSCGGRMQSIATANSACPRLEASWCSTTHVTYCN